MVARGWISIKLIRLKFVSDIGVPLKIDSKNHQLKICVQHIALGKNTHKTHDTPHQA